MAHYTRFWDCERCGSKEESIDLPDMFICEICINTSKIVKDTLMTESSILKRAAYLGYLRGYRHGYQTANKINKDRV